MTARRVHGADPATGLPRALRLADLLDARFRMPGTGFRFGLDPILGLFPVVGDTIALGLGLFIVFEAWSLGVRRRVLMRMVGNLVVDWAVGSIPVVGDVADFFIKSNRRNAALMARELGLEGWRPGKGPGHGRPGA